MAGTNLSSLFAEGTRGPLAAQARPPERTYDCPDREQTDAPGAGVEAHLANLEHLD